MLWFRCNRDITNPRWNNCTSKENNAVIWIHSLKDTFNKWGKGSVRTKVIKSSKLGICMQGQVHDPQQDPWCRHNGLSINNVMPLTTGKKAPHDRTHLASARNRYKKQITTNTWSSHIRICHWKCHHVFCTVSLKLLTQWLLPVFETCYLPYLPKYRIFFSNHQFSGLYLHRIRFTIFTWWIREKILILYSSKYDTSFMCLN